ncbi:hypothetical protein I551_6013 [Mycobacterium ulcerans str. Harvey]|uniref:Uncharacterized protein n=1 Tax=Mycobacterium ulcerans str. Harvey TaxID=1299332 RepID=A0ABP3A9M6_MYCUL|nr:hypothetical protein I551_6013 [Mycobacterium ulcerans str. Harvey]
MLVVILTEVQRLLRRRQSALARQVGLLRNYVLPLGALLLLLVNATGVPAHDTAVRLLATVFGFLVLVLLLSGLNAAVFSGPRRVRGADGYRSSSSTSHGSY